MADEAGPAAATARHGLGRLWRGEYPLGLTFWLLNVAVHAAVNAVLAAFEWWRADAFPTPDAFHPTDVLAVALISLYAAYAVPAWAGLWRSAARYPGPAVWRWLARLAAVASLAALLAMLAGELAAAAPA